MVYPPGTNTNPDGTLVIDQTLIVGGTTGYFLYDNNGVVGEQPVGGSVSSVTFVIDGGGNTITTGTKGYLEVPFQCTISVATLLADRSGSIVVDIWKCTYAQFDAGATHPVASDSITGGNPPTIITDTKSQDSTLTGWTTTVSAGDILAFNVNSATSIQRVTTALKVLRT